VFLGVGAESVGEAVGDALYMVLVGAREGDAVGAEDGHARPKRVPLIGNEQSPDLVSGVTPAGMSPQKPALSQTRLHANPV